MPAPHRARLEVLFGDVDPAGIVYYPRLVHYFHVAMEQFFRDVLEVDYARFTTEHRLGHPTVRLEADFRTPLRYGDVVEIEVLVERVGRTSVAWLYRAFTEGGEDAHATARATTVNVDMTSFEKRPIPDWLRERLERYRAATNGA